MELISCREDARLQAMESTVRPHALGWLSEHQDFALPIIERLASISNPHADDAKAYLASLDD